MTNLIISGIIDGPLSGGVPKAIEFFALDDIPDLSIYGFGSANNGGGSAGVEYTFSGSASAGDYIYIASEVPQFNAFFGFDPTDTAGASSINGDDAIELFENGVVVDVFGEIDVDGTGEPWEYLDGWAYRSAETTADGTFNIDDWTFSSPNALDGETSNGGAATPFPLGTFTAGGTTGGPATELFFSEYVEGSSNNKALEIANFTGGAIDLTGYSIEFYFNGSDTAGTTIDLGGNSVADQDVFVVADDGAVQAVLDQADLTPTNSFFNGDDAIALVKDGTIIDVIGQIGADPGSEWSGGGIGTQNEILRRSSSVTAGDTDGSDAFDPSAEWEGFPQDTFDGLGSHSIDGGNNNNDPTLAISATDAIKAEGDSNTTAFTFTVTRSGDTSGAASVDFAVSSNVADGNDFDGGTLPTGTVNFTEDETSQTVEVLVAGDTVSESDEDFTVTLSNASGAAISTADANGTIQNDDGVPLTLVSDVQGSGAASALVGQTVTIEAVVVGDYQDGVGTNGDLNGFFVQEEDADADGDALTSEGLFVFDGSSPAVDVNVGDVVQVTGTVGEFFDATQLSDVSVTVQGTDSLPTAAIVNLPAAASTTNDDGDFIADLEQFEGMRVTVPDTLFVTEYFNLDRFGQITLSANGVSNAPGTDGRLDQYTQFNDPDAAGFAAYQAEIGKRRIVLDDGQTVQNPDPLILGRGGNPLSSTNTLRGGDTVENLSGILNYSFGEYRIQPTAPVDFQPTNPRPETPENVGGDLTVVSFNVLNFFTTLDVSGNPGSGPNNLDPRGADSQAEFDRQLEKLVTALESIDGDIVGLIELENEFSGDQNGDGQFAIDTLVNALNDRVGAGTYAFVEPGSTFVDSSDAISVGAIYKTSTVKIADETTVEVLRDADLPSLGLSGTLFDGPSTNRAPLAATFEEIATGEKLTVAVNHFKSKGGTGSGDDADIGDGQGNFNGIRTRAAEALDAWLATDPTGSGDEDFLIIGDLNAYAQEDPIKLLESKGYQNVVENPASAYSFVFSGQFGTLDYGLANSTLISQVTGATEWPVNADEPDALDYNLDFGRNPALFDGSDPFRNSDHDPLIIGLDLTGTPSNVIEGTERRDTLRGTKLDDVIRGFGERDRLFGFAGDDVLEGGDGNDVLLGSNGADTLTGGADNDRLLGGNDDDVLIGGSGKDALFGGKGDDLLEGGDGNDRLFGSRGDDTLMGGAGNDSLFGAAGQDTAVLTGVQADYRFSGSARRVTANSDEFGRDRLIGIEFVQFDAAVVSTADLF
ncbi:MAG: ExeM/NucH family extracellular endonuclease [Cyanobacteria bacterium J06650_10]